MARQEGIIKLKGRIGSLSFYKNQGSYLARTKGGIDGERLKTDPRFERTRENGREFLRAIKAGKLLRDAFRERLYMTADNRMSGRLTSLFSKVIKTDAVSTRGERLVMAGQLDLLNGFEFNMGSNLDKVFSGSYVVEFNRETGLGEVNVAAFNPGMNFQKPEGATHAQLVLIAGEFDFDGLSYNTASGQSVAIDLSLQNQEALTIQAQLNANSTGAIVLMLGVMFYQSVNGVQYKMNNGASNALRVVHTLGVV